MKPFKLLVIGDSPILFTGFACVVRNFIKHWRKHFRAIDVWGINHTGWPSEYPSKIYPGGTNDWNSGHKLSQLLNLISVEEYTHIWMLGDLNNFSATAFPRYLRQVCDKKGIHVTYYCPVDAAVNPKWLTILGACDAVAAYTEYGVNELRKAGHKGELSVIPHGVDSQIYRPLKERALARKETFSGFDDGDFVLLNVNRNERRKAPLHTLQIFKGLLDAGVKARLVLHMPDANEGEGVSLAQAAMQIGLGEPGKTWMTMDSYFVNGNGTGTVDEAGMNTLYNSADLCITTALGEGWGLSMTEAIAAGCPVAMPLNTALAEIHAAANAVGFPAIGLPSSKNGVLNPMDSSRVRYPVDVEKSVEMLAAMIKDGGLRLCRDHMPCCVNGPERLTQMWNWENSADKFATLMKVA